MVPLILVRVNHKNHKKMDATSLYSNIMAKLEWCPSMSIPPPWEKPSIEPWKSAKNKFWESFASIKKKVPLLVIYRIHRFVQKTSQRRWWKLRITKIRKFYSTAFDSDSHRWVLQSPHSGTLSKIHLAFVWQRERRTPSIFPEEGSDVNIVLMLEARKSWTNSKSMTKKSKAVWCKSSDVDSKDQSSKLWQTSAQRVVHSKASTL